MGVVRRRPSFVGTRRGPATAISKARNMKRLVIISVFAVTLTGCLERTRVNCERIKNKAPETVGTQTQIGGGRCA